MNSILDFAVYALGALKGGLYALALPAAFFVVLAFAVKGRDAWAGARRAGKEIRINLSLHFFDAVFVPPLLIVALTAANTLVRELNLILFQVSFWEGLGVYPTLFLAIFLGDFAGYWRHRLEHTSLLWPGHATHHSDTEMTWLTLSRFHPINRVTTAVIDSSFLAVMGLPAWAVAANALVRHYYGYFIHADLPWTYGPLGHIFVSPVMHRWHHAREQRYAGTNFATVFSVFDRAFGTLSVPGPCKVPLGIEDNMGHGARGQLLYPFKIWAAQLLTWGRGTRDKPVAGG